MDEENINNDFMVTSYDAIQVENKVLILVKKLGLDINPKKLIYSLCTKSYIFENYDADKIEHLKLLDILGFSLLHLIACIGKFTDGKITNKKLTDAISSDKQRMSMLFYKNNNLNDLILFGNGERLNHKEFYQDIVHQVLFTLFEQTDFYKVYEVLSKYFMNENLFDDYKTFIQEYTQRHKAVPQYKIVKEYGPDHAKQFEVELTIMSQSVKAVGKSKKLAEQEAAKLYILKNKLQITDNIKIESSPLRLGDKWDINPDRRKQLTAVLGNLGIDQSKLPLYMLDACFTHKSFLFENSWAVGESFDNLSLLGSAVLWYVIDLELMKYFDTMCGGSVGRLTSIKGGLISADNLSKLFKPNWLPILKRGNGLAVLESRETRANILQAMVGAIFLNAFQNNVVDPFDIVIKVVNKLIPIHKEIESDNVSLLDFSSWLQNLNTALGLELFQTKLIEEGPAHKRTYTVCLSVFHPLNKDLDFISEGAGESRKKATRQASKNIIEQLKMNFNLSDYSIYCNSEDWKHTLSKLISIALKPGTFQQNNIDLIGGLCLKSWSDTAAINILNNLYDNMLFSEIRTVYELWDENNLSEKADAVITSHPNSNELIELILFNQNDYEDIITDNDNIELVTMNEQQLEKNQNKQEVDEAEEPLTPIVEEGLERIDKVMAKEEDEEKEKHIEEVKLYDETKIKREKILNVGKSIEIDARIDRGDKQKEIIKSEDRPTSEIVVNHIPQIPINGVNKREGNSSKAEISKSNKTKEKNKTDKIQTHQIAKPTNSNKVKLHKVHSRILRFASEQCPYCGEKLNNYNRIFSVNQKTEARYIESSVKCCLVCDICGLTEIGITKLSERGFSPQFYQGSPTFFQSTVLTKALSSENIIQISLQEHGSATVQKIEEDEPLDLDEIINGVPTKRRRVVTPEKLTETLERNNRIGLAGEKYVLEWEKGYLEKIGRSDLAKQIIWEAQRNCAAGYDILSCNPDGTPKYIEVKSTSGDKMPFYISANEWEWAKYLGHQYSIYRVFNVFGTPYIEKFDDPIDLYKKDKIKLTPTSFRATLT